MELVGGLVPPRPLRRHPAADGRPSTARTTRTSRSRSCRRTPGRATRRSGCTSSGSRSSSTAPASWSRRLGRAGLARRSGADDRRADRVRLGGGDGSRRRRVRAPGLATTGKPPKVVVTFVYDGGGWNVLRHWPDDWPHLKRLMGGGANYRNALTGLVPRGHGVRARDDRHGNVPPHAWHHRSQHPGRCRRLAQGLRGTGQRRSIGRSSSPTLADLYSDATGNRGLGRRRSAIRSGTWA